MGAGDCSRFMHFFTPIFNDEAIGAIAKLQRKTQTRLAHGLVVRLSGSGLPVPLPAQKRNREQHSDE